MKHWLLGVLVVAVTATAPTWTEAKRLGSGGSAGMQRTAPAKTPPQSPPPQQAAQPSAAPQQAAPAAPAAGAATAAAAAPAKRSWMGPIAGLAAGLGLAALMSHLGLGEAFANFLMMALLAVAVVFLIAFLMRRFGKPAAPATLASAGAASGAAPWGSAGPSIAQAPATPASGSSSAFTPASADVSVTGQPLRPMGGTIAAQPLSDEGLAVRAARWSDPLKAPALPEGFDLPAFERVAKMIFIRLQAANDAGDLDDLRQFTTPEMFAAIRLDLQDRSGAAQHTDVQKVEASVVDFASEGGRQIVSVRFHGMIREDEASAPEAFDEVWHLVKPEGEGSWAIAGIQQAQ